MALPSFNEIDVFTIQTRNENDDSNKKREDIITKLMGNQIPDEFFSNNEEPERSKRWLNLKEEVTNFISSLNSNELEEIVKVIPRGGRKYNYDITLSTTKKNYNLEFKFNASTIYDTPQFVSPMKPSQYLSSSYEEYYYNTYFGELCKNANFEKPTLKEYVDSIHNNKPKVVLSLQELYYKGCKTSSKYTGDDKAILFYTYANMVAKESIEKFIEKNDIDIEKLNAYLKQSQNDKIYMMYKNGKLYKEYVNMDNYIITKCTKDSSKSRYLCETKSGIKLSILLRWKNGNGIAFPAFQISQRKITNKKCKENTDSTPEYKYTELPESWLMIKDGKRYWITDENEQNGDVYDYNGRDEDGDPAPGKKIGTLVNGDIVL